MTTQEEQRAKLRDKMSSRGLKVSDPEFSAAAEVAVTPAAAGGEKETTRLTFVIPHDKTMLSLGKLSPAREADEGITARTENHILLDVEKDIATYISLGKESAYGKHQGSYGLTAKSSRGYSMVTAGTAWSESKKSNVVLSQTGDMIVGADAKKVLVRANTKSVEVTGKEKIVIGSPGPITMMAHSGVSLPGVTYETDIDDTLPTSVDGAASGWAGSLAMIQDTIVNVAGTVFAMAGGVPAVSKESHLFAPADPSIEGYLIGVFNTFGGLGLYGIGDGSDVGITAERNASLTGGQSAALFGGAVAGVGSLGFSSMFGNTAGVTGVAGLGLVGVAGAEMASARSCSVVSGGSTGIFGAKEVRLESMKGWASVGSKELTQVTSLGKTAIHGSDYASLGTSFGGVVATEKEVFLGVTDKSEDLGKTKAKDDTGITISAKQIKLKVGSAELTLKSNGEFHFKGTKSMATKVGSVKHKQQSGKHVIN